LGAKPEKDNDFDSNDPMAWINRGLDLAEQGKHEEAIRAFDQAVELDPEDVDA